MKITLVIELLLDFINIQLVKKLTNTYIENKELTVILWCSYQKQLRMISAPQDWNHNLNCVHQNWWLYYVFEEIRKRNATRCCWELIRTLVNRKLKKSFNKFEEIGNKGLFKSVSYPGSELIPLVLPDGIRIDMFAVSYNTFVVKNWNKTNEEDNLV